MKNKVYGIVTLIEGICMIAVSVIIAVYKTLTANVIGGADWPTFLFHFQKTSWLALAGIVLSAIAVVVLKIRKE